ncbi:DnaJ-class molecular chaperone CbpA (plasmid) [Sinorhizobium sojae CCBAU 05684]|uniref:DnaJ-class molecular chaperone CbpA n=1 Tax=Sinorhizobium sojae CCBAU 05684 TaxID=716928 RepID=A0A249PIA1_9HYPH|nr:DnaJ C-terminal domain-containing protein [Sinorhizobium sojae]ASY65641.1 DnaJ-class molecular chaperone CbpA [Sinorhizobium sojae CCBAU 05684]
MSDDPYQVLGVSRTATQDDIRKAYRQRAKQLHPDLHPGDKEVEAQFKALSAAYQLLNNPEQRARFDRGEIDASGAERPQQHFYRHYADADQARRYTSSAGAGEFEDMSDIFSDLFGRGRGGGRFKARGQDLYYQLEIEFLEAVNGARRRITFPDGNTLDLTIPAGTRDASTLRLKGKGTPGIGGGENGDALIQVSVRSHPVFRREGNDIEIDLPITLYEAVLGAKVEVPTISGRVSMTVPKGSNTGNVLRLRGKGVKPQQGPAGDQRVVLNVVLPEKVDPDLEKFMEGWRGTHAYDPRGALRRAS